MAQSLSRVAPTLVLNGALLLAACSAESPNPLEQMPGSSGGSSGAAATTAGSGGAASGAGGGAGSATTAGAGGLPGMGGTQGTAGGAIGGSAGSETAGSAGSAGSGTAGTGGGEPDEPIVIDPGRTGRQDIEFSPTDADSGASTWHGDQLGTFDAGKTPQGKLVVTMGGIGNGPHTGGVYQYAAGRGFHCFAVDMYNSEGGESNEGKVYLETFSGEDLTPVANVSPQNSVMGRIKAGVAHLNTMDPGAGWNYYLDAQGEVRWDRVILFGYSYGGQTAVAATKYVAPFRAIATAAPNIPAEATWPTTMPNVADVNKCYALNSEGEADHFDVLTAMQWPGSPETVMDGAYAMIMQPPFNNTSKIIAPGGHTEFCSVAGDRYDVICDFMFGVKP